MNVPRIYADFQNADSRGRLRLTCRGTIDDLTRQHIRLVEGLQVTLYREDVEVEGEVSYSAEEQLWTAVIEWDAIRRFDDAQQSANVGDKET